jgi:cytochrome c-type biogenesis protein CcmH
MATRLRRWRWRFGVALLAPWWWFAAGTACAAAEAQPTAADPALEARVNALSAELRCLVCQNQSLADSHADLAIDLKNQVREQLKAGRSDRQVIDYMTDRYGDFVLYRPPVKATTLLLWVGPALLLLCGGALLWRMLGARARTSAPYFPFGATRSSAGLAELLEPTPDETPTVSERVERHGSDAIIVDAYQPSAPRNGRTAPITLD